MPSVRAASAADRLAAWEIISANVARAMALIEQAADGSQPARLYVLPEFAFSGPPQGGSVQAWIDKACYCLPGPVTAPLQALAARRQIYIGGNMFETGPDWAGRYFNSCFLIGPNGDVILRFRRINTATFPSPHDFLDEYLARYGFEGTFPVVDTPLGRLAMIACGEIAVPEVARVLMMRGAEVILHPTNEAYSPAQEAAKVARAGENMAYVVSANVAGGIGFSPDGSIRGGRSRILDFRGETLACQPDAEESVAVSAVIDVQALRDARCDLGMANTLIRTRWEMYREFYQRMAAYPANHFLQTPMSDPALARPAAEMGLANLISSGVIAPR